MKLTPKQKEVVQLMRDGWGLAITGGMHPKTWMQYGGIGRGGKVASISFTTLSAMYQKRIITHWNCDHTYTEYVLTDLGKTIDLK